MRLFAASLILLAAASAQDNRAGRFVVHEWGTFTSVAGADGGSLEWRPLAEKSDLPGFVYTTANKAKGLRHGEPCVKCGCFACDPPYCHGPTKKDHSTVRMETPVLYFYADRELQASVNVRFPKGHVTEWYPQAKWVDRGIDWGVVKILPGAREEFLREPGESHYYPARETDAAPVRVCGKHRTELEKFLFYRGIGNFDAPIRVTQEGSLIRVNNPGSDPISRVILFTRHGDEIRFQIRRGVKSEIALQAEAGSLEDLLDELQRILVSEGLYAREAAAMIRTWRDSWFEEGARVFYILPRRMTDAILPISISPAPTELVRVMVGRVEVLTPRMEREILGHVGRLGDDSFEAREAAARSLARYGRFLEPVLKRVRGSVTDPEILARIDELLGASAR
jgi:hypothetical protein